jgi:hypothetical protein
MVRWTATCKRATTLHREYWIHVFTVAIPAVLGEKNEMNRACSVHGEGRGVYWILVGKPEGKRPFERPRHRWEDNIKADLQEVGCGGMDWIELAHDRDK